MVNICKDYGWDPRDFFQWVAPGFPERPKS
jgi:hypothetical protein